MAYMNTPHRLVEENLVLDRAAAALRDRVSSLEQEHADLRSEARESERARRRAEHRVRSFDPKRCPKLS